MIRTLATGRAPSKDVSQAVETASIASPLLQAAIAEAEGNDSSTAAAKTATTQREPRLRYTTGNFRISPRKLNMLARQITGLRVKEAAVQMRFSRKRASKNIGALLHRVRATLTNNYKIPAETAEKYTILAAWVGKGHYLRRIRFHGRGRHGVMHRKFAHLKILLRLVPDMPTDRNERHLVKMGKFFKRHSLYNQLPEVKLQHARNPWDWRQFVYITKDKWTQLSDNKKKSDR